MQSVSVMSSAAVSERTDRQLITYFGLAFAITWLIFAPISLGQNGLGWLPYTLPDEAVLLLFIIAAYGPLVSAMIVTRQHGGRIRDLFRRVIQWRVGWVWYLAALFAPLVIWVAAYSIALNDLPMLLVRSAAAAAAVFIPNVLFGLIVPSLGEEPGWRGFALPRLEKRFHPVAAALILGVLHSLWHLPAIAVPALLGPLTLENVAAFTLTGTAATFIYVWIYNNSGGSILTSILLHASSNAASSMLTNLLVGSDLSLDALPFSYRWLNVIAFGAVALVLTLATRGRLGYRDEA